MIGHRQAQLPTVWLIYANPFIHAVFHIKIQPPGSFLLSIYGGLYADNVLLYVQDEEINAIYVPVIHGFGQDQCAIFRTII